ncbi:MAG: hypothetical protein ACOYD0_13425 [Candidatus Nanopelagicales bacterium]
MTANTDVSATRRSRWGGPPAWVAVGSFVVFATIVLLRATSLLEPDDYAYQASIIALSHGHLLLSNADYQSLSSSLSTGGSPGILQWVQLPSGMWVSEKNPGYPFLAVPFQMMGILRVAPIFYGALGCIGLYAGARRWLGGWGGTWAVVAYLGSGAAFVFAWRATMPTFTDASLIAGGAGAILWAMLATDRTTRARILVGSVGTLGLSLAVAVRYTNVIVLIVAVVAVLSFRRRVGLSLRAVAIWAVPVAAVGAAVMAFNQVVYGGAFATGYANGLITFSVSAVWPNLTGMPIILIAAVPGSVLALAALVWMCVRWWRARRLTPGDARQSTWRRDAAVGIVLAAAWTGTWALYSAYDWTANQLGDKQGGPGGTGGGLAQTDLAVHLYRFYLPALGLIALLVAWLLVQLPKWMPPVLLLGLTAAGLVAFASVSAGAGQGGRAPGVPSGSGGQVPPGVKPPSGLPQGGPGQGGLPQGGLPQGGSGQGGPPQGAP